MKKVFYNLLVVFIICFIYYSYFYCLFAASPIKGTITEDLGDGLDPVPVQGVVVRLIEPSGSCFLAYSDAEGKFEFKSVPSGSYDLEYRYGDLEVLDLCPTMNLTPEQVLKYNGQDYIATHMNGVTEELAQQVIPQIGNTAAQVFLVVDASGSMKLSSDRTNENNLTRMDIVKQASKILVDDIIKQDEDIYVGLIQFNSSATMLSHLCRDPEFLKEKIDGIEPLGVTNVAQALELARSSFVDNEGAKIIIFLSDGEPTDNINNVKAKIDQIRNEDIELFSLIIEDDVNTERIRDIFNNSTVLVFKKTGYELASCIDSYIPQWIIQKVIEIREELPETETLFDIQYGGQKGIEDEDRRELVDSSFSNVFHYNHKINSSDIAGRTRLFKALEDSSEFSEEELNEFSNATYMTVTYKDLIVKDNTTVENLDLRLKRREPFSMQISTKAVAMRVTLSDNTILVNDIDDSENFHMFYDSLDDDIVRGSTVEIEYKVCIRNNSNTMACTQLQLLSYFPEGLTLNNNQKLLTNSRKTNYSNGWHLANKDILYEDGIISEEAYNSDLMDRGLAMFYGDSNSGLCIKPNSTFVTHFVTSMCIGDVYQIEYNHLNAVEIVGYRNTQYRRMENFETQYLDEENGSVKELKSNFISVYPGDGRNGDIDYATDTNREFILPPTGKKYNNIVLYIMLVSSITLFISYIIVKKSK